MNTYVTLQDLRPGDSIVGMGGFRIATITYAGELAVGGSAERQIYTLTAEDGRTMNVPGVYRANIIRR